MITLHKPVSDIHFFSTIQSFKRSAPAIQSFWMPIAPFRKFVAERIEVNNMLPLQPPGPFRFSFGNIALIVDQVFPLCELGAAIKGFLMAAVNFPHQDSFGLGEGLNLAVAFLSSMNRHGDRADQKQHNYKMSEFLHLTILNLCVGKAKLKKAGHPIFFLSATPTAINRISQPRLRLMQKQNSTITVISQSYLSINR